MTPDHEKALFAPIEFRLFWAEMFNDHVIHVCYTTCKTWFHE